jgi:rubredoxin
MEIQLMPRKPRCPKCGGGKFSEVNKEWVCKTCGYLGSKRMREKKSKKARGVW